MDAIQSEPKKSLRIFEKHIHTTGRGDLLSRQGFPMLPPLPVPEKPSWHLASYRYEGGEAARRLGHIDAPALTILLTLESDLPANAFERAAAEPLLAEINAAIDAEREKFLAGDESQVKANARRKQLADSEAELADTEAALASARQAAAKVIEQGGDSRKHEDKIVDSEKRLPLIRERIATLVKLAAAADSAAEQKLSAMLSAKRAELQQPHAIARDKLRQQIATWLGEKLTALRALSAASGGY